MKVFQSILILSLFLIVSTQLNAQQLSENEVVVIKGEKFVIHQVRTGETIYSISRTFQTDSLTLVQNNPKLAAEGLKIGDVLKIPYKKNIGFNRKKAVYQKGDPSHFEFHTITSRKQTPYFIAKKYGITVEEIYAYNPEVRKFKKGTRLRIPVWEKGADVISGQVAGAQKEEGKITEKAQEAANNNLIAHEVLPGETLYSLSKKYKVTESEILFFNPSAKNLKAGSTIFLPEQKVAPEQPIEAQPEIVEIPDIKYFDHTIESGETLWGITRKYAVSEEELISLNPVLKNAFPAGAIIRIPVQEVEQTVAQPVNEEAFIHHIVQKGENLFRLSSNYNLEIPEIKKYNPALENRNVVYVGETILIPRRPDPEIVNFIGETPADSAKFSKEFYKIEVPENIPESCLPDESGGFSNEKYEIVLFLPLFVETNDTLNNGHLYEELADTLLITDEMEGQDTTVSEIEEVEEEIKEDPAVKFYGNSENYIQFYEGVLLAVDSMQRAGMNIQLNVFDTKQNAGSIREIIYNERFLETDLIIGPVFQEVQKEVAQIAAKNRIPIVSPLGARSNEIKSNPWFYQVNPSNEYLAAQTAEMVAEEYFNSNFIVCRTGNYGGTSEERLVEMMREKLYNSGYFSHENGVSFSVYDFKNEGPFGLRRILSKTKENVVFIPSKDEGELSVAISNIFNLSDDFSITLIGANHRYQQQYQSINVEHFHNLKLKYVAPYWMDYKSPFTINYVEKFKENFGTEPNNYGVQGYDVAFYFLNALKYFGHDFRDCLAYLRLNLIQGNYNFEKVSEFGGYMNHGVSVISNERNYEVVRRRLKGQPNIVAEN